MKDKIISVSLETSTSPVITEVRGRDWISYGDANGEWANLYPQFLIDLYYSSSISAAIINATADMINGKDIIIDDEEDGELNERRVKLQNFMDRANSNETLHEVLKKVAFDFKLQGAYALNIVWSKDRTQIAEIYHVPVEKIRVEKPDELGKVRGYFVSNDWTNTRTNKPYRVPAFNANDRTSANQILYTGLYSPNMNAYFTPDYVSCNNWALIDSRVSEYHLNNISNGFSGSYMISFANGIPSAEERNEIERSLAAKFTSQDNAGKFILTFSDDKTRVPEITPISPSDLDKQYLALQEMLTSNIMSGHRVTSPMLMGIKNDTGLGNNADELNSAANFYLNSVVMPYQHQILKTLSKLFKINDMDMSVSFVQLKPITLEFTSEDLKGIMSEDELREEMGLAPLDVEVREDFSKVEKTELDSFIEEFGEDINEDWELVEEEIVDGEHQDFNFEEVLNDVASEKIELASTGSPKPGRKSEQDGISKKTSDYFRVRYVYENDNFLTNKSGTKRKFCRQMMGAKKLYRKEDIINMGKKAVNPGFGPHGSDTYSIWLYKGGPQCFHFWTRRIFKTVIGESKTTKIEDADLIGYTKARSEGFTAKKNDRLVAIPPRKMNNNGYLN